MNAVVKAFSFVIALAVVAGCSSESSTNMLTPKGVIPKEEVSEKPKDFTVFTPKVDILFVIDSSGSMDFAQQNLSRNAFQFADAISKVSFLDYHIGVLTTDMDDCRDHCGRLVGYPTYVEKSTVDKVGILSRKMLVGTNGSASEEMFGPVVAALSPGLENSFNKGFYRQDAFLAVIFITDAKDQSNYSPQDLLHFLNTKKADPNRVLGYGVIRTLAEEQICDSSEDLDSKLEEFLASVVNGDKMQKNILSLCTPDYGVKLAEFAKDIIRRTAGAVKLNRVPNEKTIKVSYGTQVIPNSLTKGWVYQPSTNSILLSEGIEWVDQGPNVGLAIDFEAIDVKD
ncbi:VWA domain-containing protein [Bdellovibrio sp. 22V]|uniref:VWA domain-containing protein n=1 Tax=Bdellovibrio TaxID=958 RepID=UPI00254287E7|nr:VWA domain-containing protein [Bdellovibrio sp. 22V]WII73610.1 VWA domain-containing protein [Bdellovibrio sp. 22V]